MQGLLVTLVSIGVTILFILGVPIFLVIGIWVVGVSLIIDFTLANIGVTLFEGLNFFGLLALPLFILTGDLIAAAGIARRMTAFAYSILGWLRGGLALTTLGACGMFAAISGSNSATTAAIGQIMYPEMVKAGYDKRFAAATCAAGGTVGIIIPPSVIFIVYGFLLNLSISELFIAGILPGLLMVVAMQLVGLWMARRNPDWGVVVPFRWAVVGRTALGAYLGFIAIFIVIFGIYSGIFSPTEAAGVTAGFCLLAGLFITREITWRSVPDVLLRSGQVTGLLAPMIAVSVVMQQILSVLGAREFVTGLMANLGGYYPVLFTCMGIVLVAGCILESLPDTIILAPILAPIAAAAGVDPIHFAVIFLIGDAIGFITPPYGLNLFVASGFTGIPYLNLLRHTMPYLVSLMIVWMIVALWPALSLALLTFDGAGVFQAPRV
jgi:C4-dicarboxylate transporter DctM subunit